MSRLLLALGFTVNDRRRAPCALHGGSNPSAFAWRNDGRWHCFSCGASGDRIALIRAVRQCGFNDALAFLAALAGVEYQPNRLPLAEIARRKEIRQRAERAAWLVTDELSQLRRYYMDALHRTERLQSRIADGILRTENDPEREVAWDRLARLAPAGTYFLAGFSFVFDAQPDVLARFVLARPADRRAMILDGYDPKGNSDAA